MSNALEGSVRGRRAAGVFSLALLALVAAAACGGGKGEPKAPGTEASPPGPPAFLSLIPADTPYVFATLDRTPKEYITREYLSSAAEAERVIELLGRLREQHPQEFEQLGTFERITLELLAEVKGKLSEEGLAGLGIRLDAHAAIYGIGLLPVVRVELLDGDRFRAALGRILDRAQVRPEERELAGHSYFAVSTPEMPWLQVAVAVVGDELVATAVPDHLAATLLPLAFGAERPARSLADSGSLDAIRERYHFSRWGLGYLDLAGVTRALVGDGTGAGKEIAAGLDLGLDGAACANEIPDLAGPMPRVVLGTYGFEGRTLSGAAILELEAELARDLAGMTAPVPGLSRASARQSPLAFGIGIDLARLQSVLKSRLGAIAASPYRCEHLLGLNELAQSGPELAVMMSTLPSVTGASVILEKLELDPSGTPREVEGLLFLGSEDPGALVDLASQHLGAQAASVTPGAPPIEISVPFLGKLHLAAGKHALGVAIGPAARAQARLTELLALEPAAGSLLFLSHIEPDFTSRLSSRDEVAEEYTEIAVLDPELARVLTEMDRNEFEQYERILVEGRATERGVELRFEVTYHE